MRLLKKYFETSDDVTIDDEGLVSCTGQVVLKQVHQHTTLPVAFGSVGGDFYCGFNQLKTLEGAPQTVGGGFYCFTNQLKTLEGAPQTVGGSFSCSSNQLITLEGAPQTVGGSFNCYNNKLTTLEGAPQTVGGGFYCFRNQLTTLAGAPQTVGDVFNCSDTPLATLEGIPIKLKLLQLSYSPNLPLLRTLYAQEVEFLPKLRDPAVLEILNRYAGEGKRGVIRCQKELIAAGFEGNARW